LPAKEGLDLLEAFKRNIQILSEPNASFMYLPSRRSEPVMAASPKGGRDWMNALKVNKNKFSELAEPKVAFTGE
jgi:hypothetical protein